MRPLVLPVNPPDQAEFNRRVANAANQLRTGILPAGAAVPYFGATAPAGFTTASPGPTLTTGWIWITPTD